MLGFSVGVLPGLETARMFLDNIAEYRRKAEECRRQADATNDVLFKMHWLELADTWTGLAASAERVYTLEGIRPGSGKKPSE